MEITLRPPGLGAPEIDSISAQHGVVHKWEIGATRVAGEIPLLSSFLYLLAWAEGVRRLLRHGGTVFSRQAFKGCRLWRLHLSATQHVNDPSAGSPTETLLRLLLPLNDQVWSSFRQHRRPHEAIAAHQSEDLTKSFNRFATILPPEPKSFGFPEAARRVIGGTSADRWLASKRAGPPRHSVKSTAAGLNRRPEPSGCFRRTLHTAGSPDRHRQDVPQDMSVNTASDEPTS
ncbi:hypothetical protein J6590_080366 [Homalodisca vitripennis]|nr:hypothetical protein J6590_080366 [Homalodisca vitripennis]